MKSKVKYTLRFSPITDGRYSGGWFNDAGTVRRLYPSAYGVLITAVVDGRVVHVRSIKA